MIHIRVDGELSNKDRRFACGLGPELPPGDTYFFTGEPGADRTDCQGCNPAGPRRPGTPISELSSRPGQKGYAEWQRISRSWGYE